MGGKLCAFPKAYEKQTQKAPIDFHEILPAFAAATAEQAWSAMLLASLRWK